MDIVKSLDLTVISAIHDLNIAAMYCDRLFVMKDGHIVGFGTPEEMLTQERIKEIYEVDAEVIKDSQGHLHLSLIHISHPQRDARKLRPEVLSVRFGEI